MQEAISLWPLIGIAVIVVGFVLRFNPVLVVIISGIVTGVAAHMPIATILEKLGEGFLNTRNLPFILLLPLAVIVAGWLLMRRYCPTVFTRVAAGLIVGGFLGNFGERLLFGSVVDMLYFPWLPWFICNVADIAICFGVAMLVISTLLRPQDWRERRENDSAAGGN